MPLQGVAATETTVESAARSNSEKILDSCGGDEDGTSTRSDSNMEDVNVSSRGEIVDKVEDMDVLCGRGCNRLCHPGNKRFRVSDKPSFSLGAQRRCKRGGMTRGSREGRFLQQEVVGAQKERYQRATKREDKTRITLEILKRLMCSDEEPSRFLLKDSKANCWVDVGFEYAKEKVSHALRSRPTAQRRTRAKPKKKVMRKPSFSPELEEFVQGMISDQQMLLQSLIEREAASPPRPEVLT